MRKIVPNLWFDTEAEEATEFYVSLFDDSKILDVLPYPESGPGEPGSTMLVTFQLLGQEYAAINGGPQFPFTEAVSFEVQCDSQEEVDRLWEALTADGGQEVQCGWLKDRYGLSWQIVPARWVDLVKGPDAKKVEAAYKAMLEMKKLDMAELERAYEAG
jgi:predicted 3-demethylubiquinone-9 3-methyltransferase (glyoxalase superfamily)